jgi:hypothetical protein
VLDLVLALTRVHLHASAAKCFVRPASVLHQSNRTLYTSFCGAADWREEAYNEGVKSIASVN